MTSTSVPKEGVDVEVRIDGELVWSGASQSGTSAVEWDEDNGSDVCIDIALGPEIASRARVRMTERVAQGADNEATLEDLLWEFVDVRLSAIER